MAWGTEGAPLTGIVECPIQDGGPRTMPSAQGPRSGHAAQGGVCGKLRWTGAQPVTLAAQAGMPPQGAGPGLVSSALPQSHCPGRPRCLCCRPCQWSMEPGAQTFPLLGEVGGGLEGRSWRLRAPRPQDAGGTGRAPHGPPGTPPVHLPAALHPPRLQSRPHSCSCAHWW